MGNVQSRKAFAYAYPLQEMGRNLDENAKIVKIDTGRPRDNSKRRNDPFSDPVFAEPSISSTISAGCHSLSNIAFHSSSHPQNEGSIPLQNVSPVMSYLPTRLYIPSSASDGESASASQDLNPATLNGKWGLHGDDYKFSTAQSGPRCCSGPSKSRRISTGPFIPLKSGYADSLFQGYVSFSNYMVNIESSRAKVFPHGGPKQRTDPSDKTAFSVEKRMPLHDAKEKRASLSSVCMERSYSQAHAACKGYQRAGSMRIPYHSITLSTMNKQRRQDS